ncbi:MAG: hypothetical protein KDK54_18000 [Leptospiraceae bacterium]|nr:hypothetical protein [Leptospiraceae bacterium]
MNDKKNPRFSVFPILISGFLLYSFLNTIIITFSLIREFPQVIIEQNPTAFRELIELHQKLEEVGKSKNEIHDEMEEKFERLFDPITKIDEFSKKSVDIVNSLFGIIGLTIVIYYHLPLFRYFHRLRKEFSIPEELRILSQKRIVYSAYILGFVPVGIIIIALLFNGITLYFKIEKSDLKNLILTAMALEFFSTILVGTLIYHWQKYRTQHYYIQYIFKPEELREKFPIRRDISLKNRLWLLVTVTTFFPLSLVLLFVLPSISIVDSVSLLNEYQIEMLLGDYFQTIEKAGIKDIALEILYKQIGLANIPFLLFVNIIDTPILIAGLFVGIFISVVYSIVLIRFSTANIITPLKELQTKMLETSKTGNYENYVRVQNNDEFGDLGEGFNKMLHGLAEKEKVKSLFGQYLTREISEEILNGRVKMGGDRFEATIMFSDIRNFTNMSEKMMPEEVLSFLNSYMEIMIDVIVEEGGIIDKFMGDGILAIFGVPIRSNTHAEKALNAAIKMQIALGNLNQKRNDENKNDIKIGIGIHTGTVIAGNIGNHKKTEYTVIGDTVNLASRIEGLTKQFESSILISDATYKLLPEKMMSGLSLSPIPETKVRGKNETVNLYQVQLNL